MKRRIAILGLATVLCLSLVFGVGAATKPKLNAKKITITKGEQYKLKVKGKNIKKKTFMSTNKKVATVSKKGVVTAVNVGSCKIKVIIKLKNKKKKKLTCKVTVVKKQTPKTVQPTKKPAATQVPTTCDPDDIIIQRPTRKPTETTPAPTTKEKPTFKLPDINV
ncbi:MAG: Ig-like domain-containing protein [Eubacterium sp.]|nr:Ig-like domain-containing protein [Eubacterium sp.]